MRKAEKTFLAEAAEDELKKAAGSNSSGLSL
jgi:hypothetical protein